MDEASQATPNRLPCRPAINPLTTIELSRMALPPFSMLKREA